MQYAAHALSSHRSRSSRERLISVLYLPATAVVLVLVMSLVGSACSEEPSDASSKTGAPAEITVDWAYYSPVSIAIKEFGWMEEEFAADGTNINWVLSLGSNKANEYSQSGTADFASTAGIAALMARANGIPIQTVYTYSKPEWTALVAPEQSSIRTLADVRGKSVAATKGTDPWFFLIQALETQNLDLDDVDVKHMQHPDGGTALSQGQVDAWAGLDPHMAKAELQDAARLVYRNPDFNTYGTLNALTRFTEEYPEATRRVIEVYERGRRWVLQHPEEAADLLAKASGVSPKVARTQVLKRTDLSNPIPGSNVRELLGRLAPILHRHDIVRPSVDLQQAIDDLLAPQFARAVVDTTNTPYVDLKNNVPVGVQAERIAQVDSSAFAASAHADGAAP